MPKSDRSMGDIVGLTEGARTASGGIPTTDVHACPLMEGQRWSLSRNRDGCSDSCLVSRPKLCPASLGLRYA